MSLPSDVFRALTALLQESDDLSYIKQVLEGQRELDSITEYPSIIVDYIASDENDDTYSHQRITMTVSINVIVKVFDKDKQIIGTTTEKGILDIINDIKNVIDTDRTLGGQALHTQITSDSITTDNFPVRVLSLTCNILYEQTEGNR